MPVIVIGGVDYNSFASVEFATQFLAADMIRAPIWEALDADQQKRALITATRILLTMPWCGTVPDPAVDQDEPIPSVTAMFAADLAAHPDRSEEHTSELQSLMRISYAVFCLKKKNNKNQKPQSVY